MQAVRQHILTRLLCGIVAAIILNLSVDAPDFQPELMPEDLSYNDIESVVEWVLEDVMQIPNAIPEHDDNDNSNPQKFNKHIDFFYELRLAVPTPVFATSFVESGRNFGDPDFHAQSVSNKLIQPPEA